MDEIKVIFDSSIVSNKEEILHTQLQSTGVHVDIIDLSYNVNINGNTKYLLENVSLSIHPGDMVALMGPSGLLYIIVKYL